MTAVFVLAGVWLTAVTFVVALCKSAARGDRKAGRP
jgi:hypothetical protein